MIKEKTKKMMNNMEYFNPQNFKNKSIRFLPPKDYDKFLCEHNFGISYVDMINRKLSCPICEKLLKLNNMKKRLDVGQKIYVVPSKYSREPIIPVEYTISKVGNKYFELDNFYYNKFSIETLTEFKDFGDKMQCYLSLEDFNNEQKAIELTEKFNKIFRYNDKLSLDKLLKINEIIDNSESNNFDLAIKYIQEHYCNVHLNTPYLLLGDVAESIKILTGKEIDMNTLDKYKK